MINQNSPAETETHTEVVPGPIGRMIDTISANKGKFSLGLATMAAAGGGAFYFLRNREAVTETVIENPTETGEMLIESVGLIASLPLREVVSRLIA
jgi:hypothetical protein